MLVEDTVWDITISDLGVKHLGQSWEEIGVTYKGNYCNKVRPRLFTWHIFAVPSG